ncbi:glutathione transferase GstA [Bradyrhizobium semiaridum]|uniref:glutathione transferase GstA n=1 Tax=Bradyrhizobium semiaridum TaxID=2821404 RepID=UPI001CE27F96|nr:glutathione transferase GstA [Bradyrhizobium semiaridum]
MMKLYSAPNSCSLSPHIVLRELELPFKLVMVNNKTKRTSEGGNFLEINPKGYVAALQLDGGEIITEGPAIVQYLADLKPAAGLAPPSGSLQRVRLQEWLNFITSEIHATSHPLFNAEIPENIKQIFKERLFRRFGEITATLEAQDHLLGDSFGIADAYLYTVLLWMKSFSIDLARWPAIQAYMERIARRPHVQAALDAEARASLP